MLRAIWPDSFVDEGNLAAHIRTIRRSLELAGDRTEHIQTVPRHGYRFVTEVRKVEMTPASVAVPEQEESPASIAQPLRQPRRIWLVAALVGVVIAAIAGGVLPYFNRARRDANPEISIAVLPFANLTGDPGNDYFADGLTEELIDRLGRNPALRVISRTSAFALLGKGPDLAQVAVRLRVGYILEGSLRKSEDRWRLTAHLANTVTGVQTWTDTIELPTADLFGLEDELSAEVGKRLGIRLALPAGTASHAVLNWPAHDLVLRGRYQLDRRTDESFREAYDYFQKALRLDPSYAPALAELSAWYTLMSESGLGTPGEMTEKARAAALKAVAVDESLPVAHLRLGLLKMQYDHDMGAAEKEVRRAEELDPGDAATVRMLGFILMLNGRTADGVKLVERALRTDPLSIATNADYAMALHFAHRYDDAIEQSRKTLELAPKNAVPYYRRGWALALSGRYRLALDDAIQMEALGTSPAIFGALRGYCLAHLGDKKGAAAVIETIRHSPKLKSPAPYSVALIQLGLKDYDAFFSALEEAYRLPDHYLIYLKADPVVDEVRGDKRFQEFLRKMSQPVAHL